MRARASELTLSASACGRCDNAPAVGPYTVSRRISRRPPSLRIRRSRRPPSLSLRRARRRATISRGDLLQLAQIAEIYIGVVVVAAALVIDVKYCVRHR